jgi:hypothetical protein
MASRTLLFLPLLVNADLRGFQDEWSNLEGSFPPSGSAPLKKTLVHFRSLVGTIESYLKNAKDFRGNDGRNEADGRKAQGDPVSKIFDPYDSVGGSGIGGDWHNPGDVAASQAARSAWVSAPNIAHYARLEPPNAEILRIRVDLVLVSRSLVYCA